MTRRLSLETVSPAKWNKCVCCSEQIRPCESRLSVMQEGRKTPVETYCPRCEQYALQNNPEIEVVLSGEEVDWQDRSEVERESYAAYAANGCTHAFWTDRDAGLV